jgi:formylglycine-generating enzyme required for sulfatase activity
MFSLGTSRPYDLWDMAGNVWEWQSNYYDTGYDSLALRGGAWLHYGGRARVSGRRWGLPRHDWNHDGFRVLALPK